MKSALWGVLALGLIACQPGPVSPSAQPPAARRGASATLVQVETLAATTTRTQHAALGLWQARRLLRLHNPEAGLITEVAGFEGSMLAAGSVLVRLDARRAELALVQAQASLAQAQAELGRLKQMGSQLATAQALDQAVNTQAQAQAALSLAQIRLADHTLKAPFPGVLSERKVEPGDSVASHTHLLTLYDPDSLVLRVELSEQRLQQWDGTAPAQIQCPNQAPVAAHTERRHPIVDAGSAYGVVEYRALTPVADQYPGGRCTITWTDRATTLLTLPLRAIQQDEHGEFVWVINAAQQVEQRRIRSGVLQGDRVTVVSGLTGGEAVVTQGMADLRPRQAVRVVTPGK